MKSTIDFSKDKSYVEFQCNVISDWGSTFMRAETEIELVAALKAVLPKNQDIEIIKGEVSVSMLAARLRQAGYNVTIK